MSGYDCICGNKLKQWTAKQLISSYGDVSSIFCSNCKRQFDKNSNETLYICDLPNGYHKVHTEGYGLCSKCTMSDSEISSESSDHDTNTPTNNTNKSAITTINTDELIDKLLELARPENGNGVTEEDIYLSLQHPNYIIQQLRFASLSKHCTIELNIHGQRTYFIQKELSTAESTEAAEIEEETENIIADMSTQEMSDLRQTLAPKKETHEIEHEMTRMNLLNFLALLTLLGGDDDDNKDEEKEQKIKTVGDARQELEKANNRLIDIQAKSQKIINDKFDVVIQAVALRRDVLLNKVESAVESNKEIIFQKQEKLKTFIDPNMKLPDKFDVGIENDPMIEVKIDNEKVINYMTDFGDIEYSHLPLRPTIKMLDIRSTCTELKLTSESEKDKKLCSECKIKYGKYSEDKSQIEWVESARFLHKEWVLNISGLEPVTRYVIQASLQSKYGYGEWTDSVEFITCKPIICVKPVQACAKTNFILDDEMKTDVDRLFVGDIFDGQDRYQDWYEAKLLKIGQEVDEEKKLKERPVNEVAVHFNGWEDRFDEWIDINKEPNRFAPINHYTLKYQTLAPIPMIPISQPRYCVSGGSECIIMICKDIGMVKYDINTDAYSRMNGNMSLFRGDSEFICNVINREKNLLYIMCDDVQDDGEHRGSDCKAIVYNIDDEKFVNLSTDDMGRKYKFSYPMAAVMVMDEKEDRYIYTVPENDHEGKDHCRHYINGGDGTINKERSEKFTAVHIANNFCKRTKMQSSELMHCELENKLVLVRDEPTFRQSSQINKFEWCFLNLDEGNNEWNRIELEMRNDVSKCYLLAFDQIVFVFDSSKSRPIYLIDTYTNKLYESHKRIPKLKANRNNMIQFAVKTEDNFAHLFDIHNAIHVKFDLYDMIPKELYDHYALKKKLLVAGYVNEIEDFLETVVSAQIEQIIARFYPIFL